MSRYRPPGPGSTAVITAEGEARLRAELHQLWKIERPQVTREVSDAAKLGDRSENAEYIYGKKRLREIDRRVRFLSKRLERLKVVRDKPDNPERIYFGAWVRLIDADDQARLVRLVGPDEFDVEPHYISIDSPLARALLNKAVDDDILVQTPAGEVEYWIAALSYDGPPEA